MQITVRQTPEEVQEAFKAAYEKAKAKVKLPGFRKGKVPIDLVEKHLGDSVAGDAAEWLVNRSMSEIYEELEPPPINVPSFELESFDRKDGAVFHGTYDVLPEIKPAKYKKIKITQDQLDLEDSIIEKRIEDLRKKQAVMKTREDGESQKGDTVQMKIEILEGEKSLFKHDEFPFQTDRDDVFPGLQEHATGKKIGDTVTYEQDIENDFQDERFAGKHVKVNFEVFSIQYQELPPLDDEFAKDMGDFETLADLKEDIRKQIQSAGEDVLKERALQQLVDDVIDKAKFEMPQSLIEREFLDRRKQLARRLGRDDIQLEEISAMTGESVEQITERMKKDAEKHVREGLVLMEIAKKENLEVTDEELIPLVKERYENQISPDQLDKLLESEELRKDMRFRELMKKTLDWLYSEAEVKKGKSVSAEKLFEEGALRF